MLTNSTLAALSFIKQARTVLGSLIEQAKLSDTEDTLPRLDRADWALDMAERRLEGKA